MLTIDGLLDVIAVGCVLEFTTALSRSRYHPGYDSGTDAARELRVQENQAREWFRVVMKVFGSQYLILSSGAMVDVSTIWQSVMVRFAIGVIHHIQRKKDEVPHPAGVTPKAMEKAFRLHLRVDHPYLNPAFDEGLKMEHLHELSWPMDQHPLLAVLTKSRSCHHLLRALGMSEEAREIPGVNLSLTIKQGATALRNTVHHFYRVAWPGEDSPHD